MSKFKLTIEMLENAEPSTVLFKGEIIDSPEGFHINRTGKMLKYVVVRRGIPDWCIYAEDCYKDMSFEEIKTNGNKIFEDTARVVIDADEEVWKRYVR